LASFSPPTTAGGPLHLIGKHYSGKKVDQRAKQQAHSLYSKSFPLNNWQDSANHKTTEKKSGMGGMISRKLQSLQEQIPMIELLKNK
jgi:hypothetical protein